MNFVCLVGHLAGDPEAPQQDNRPVKFTIVTDDYNASTKQREGEFHRCIAWGKTGQIIQTYAKKGRLLRVSGRIKTRSWDDAKTNTKRYATEIIVNDVELLGDKSANQKPMEDDESTSW